MPRILRRLFPAALAAIALVLTSCSGSAEQDLTSTDAVDSGYDSGDGSVQMWDTDERGEPVELAGESMTGDPVDISDWRGDVVEIGRASCRERVYSWGLAGLPGKRQTRLSGGARSAH